MSAGDLRISTAQPGQGRLVARWISRSVDPAILPFTIWRSPRAGAYVESLLANPSPAGHRFYLLGQGGRVAGLAAFRRLDRAAFLNHIVVSPRGRGRGLGRRLLTLSLRDFLRRIPLRGVALDAFRGSEAAAWYRRLGLTSEARYQWSTWGSTTGGASHHGAPRHSAFGFSSFTAGRYTVGRLWTPYYRLTDPRAARDHTLLACLTRLDPARRFLLIAPGAPPANWQLVARSDRLAGSADILLRRLEGNPDA